MKRIAATVFAVVLFSLAMSAVASARVSPRGFHGISRPAAKQQARHSHPVGYKWVSRSARFHHHAAL